jgi:hypothetical protein
MTVVLEKKWKLVGLANLGVGRVWLTVTVLL